MSAASGAVAGGITGLTRRVALAAVLCRALLFGGYALADNPAGDLRIELISGYNFVVDSNVETPATYAPRSAYLGATYYNDGDVALTNVYAYIGDYDGGTNPTPGIYPSRAHLSLIGPLPGNEFALTHEGGSLGLSDATRYLDTIEPGESKTVYWLVSYPNLDETGTSVTGGVKPDDDLWLYFDVWGKGYEGATLLEADVRRQVFMRRMLSAMANKISPNGANKVPQEYQDLLQQYEPSWTNNLVDGSPGSAIITEGIWYDLGNINQGFDNDGDLIPDYNAWMQPVGDPAIFDAGCFRLVKTFAMVVIKRSAGDVVILAEDQLYFSNLPPDNNGAVGYVRYEFMPLCSGGSATLSPYQAVASGRENEKFNGDFGATLGGGLQSQPSAAEIDKQVDLAIAGANSNLNYTVTYTNTGEVVIGRPDVGLPIVISDSIPDGTTYVAGSAAAGNTLPAGVDAYTIFYSTNNAASWTQTEPSPAADVTDIQWWLSDALEPATGGVVTFSVTVDDPAPALIYNMAGLQLGDTDPFLEDDATTLVTGDYLISGTVFADIGTGGGTFGNGILDGAEAGISNVTVTLYYDSNGDGILDDGDVFYATTVTATNGTYTFNDLPNGNYIVVVNDGDADIPQGYTLTTVGTRAATINNANVTGRNFGFAPGLILTKTGPALLEKGGQATYTIAVSNSLPATSATLQYTAWATNNVAAFTVSGGGSGTWDNPANALGVTNGTFATKSYVNGDQNLGVGGFSLPSSSATITNVRVVVTYNAGGAATWRSTDGFYIRVYTNTPPSATPIFSSAEYFPLSMHGGSGYGSGSLTNNVTPSLGWNWNNFNPANSNLFVSIDTDRSGGGRDVTLGIDGIRFIVTTSEPQGVLTNVPLYDYYDTNVLQYASSVPNISSSDTNGPPPNTGRLMWNNVGPLAPGASTNVTVTFNVIGPPGNGGIITTNRAAVTNAMYSGGGKANMAFDNAVSEVPATASIGDTIFWDANLSGSQDDSEAGVEGVTVQLYDTNNVLVAETTTDVNGFYLFAGLTPDTYTVLVVTNGVGNYPLNGTSLSAHPDNDGAPIGDPLATVSNNFTTVTVVGGQDYRGADFGYVPPGATMGGVLWIDFNDDGVLNGGESTIAFITVTLLDGDGNVVATTETDADGNYLFYGLTNGTYSVVVNTDDADFPSGLVQSVDPDGVMDSVATNIVIASFTIDTIDGEPWTAGDLEVNFGYRYAGNNSLSGTVGMDDPDNIDGLLNGLDPSGVGANETAFAGVTVYVYLWNDDGNGVVNSGEAILLGTTLTDANGDYSFANLPDGDANDYYIVSLVAPYNYLSLTTTTNDTPATLLVETENAQGHTLSAYQAVPVAPAITNMDFAFVSLVDYDFGDLPGTYRTLLADNGPRHIVNTNSPTLFLGGAVDTENNGLPSVGADGDDLDGVDDEDGVFVAGIWQNGTSKATVRVQVGAGSGWLVGYVDFDNSGSFDNANELVVSQSVSATGGPDSDGWYEITFNVPAGSLSTTNTTQFYSRWRLLPSQPFLPALAFQGEASNGEVEDYLWYFHVIGGFVFEDTDDDAVFSGGDTPQAGVVVNLYTNGTLVASTVTDFDGSYFFYGLQDGNYSVTMEEPSGSTAILDADGVGNTFTNIAVTVTGASVYGQDFLLDTNGTRYAISGTVYDDDGYGVSGNGEFGAADEPVPGATVRLYRDINADGVPDPNEFVGTTVTDANGEYAFADLPVGDYIVIIDVPDGAAAITDADGSGNGSALIQVEISVADVEGRDFLVDGMVALVDISGLVWLDEIADGIRDPAETNRFAGIPVQLLDESFNVIAETVTDVNGEYLFTNVVTDTYIVRFNLSSNYVDDVNFLRTIALQGGDPTVDSDVTLGETGGFARTGPIVVSSLDGAHNIDLGLRAAIPLDLAITKEADPTVVMPGSNIVFTIGITNLSEEVNATGVLVQDFLPPLFTFVTNATPSQGSFDTNNLVWSVGGLDTNAFASIEITVQALPGAAGSVLTNVVRITGLDQVDTNLVNNVATAAVTVHGHDLALTKTVGNPYPLVGSNVTYTIVVTNMGLSDATGVLVSEPLTNGITYVSHTAAIGTYNDLTGVWNIGALNAGASATLEITVSVDPGSLGKVITNTSCITASDLPDPNPDNDCDSAVVEIFDVELVKTSDLDGPASPGDIITYTVVVDNRGDGALTGVEIEDVVPAGTTFVPGSLQAVLDPLLPLVATSVAYNAAGTNIFVVPATVTNLMVDVWGGGGGGAASTGIVGGGGGGGGAYAGLASIAVTPGQEIQLVVGAGGKFPGPGNPGRAGAASWFSSTNTVLAQGGGGGGTSLNMEFGGPGGLASSSIGDVRHSGGSGGQGSTTGWQAERGGGGGGGSAFTDAQGGDGGPGLLSFGGAGGIGEGPGGMGGYSGVEQAVAGGTPGGGGGGCGTAGANIGADGQVVIHFELPGHLGQTDNPPIIASDWIIPGGGSLTLTYEVQVQNTLAVTQIVNTAVLTFDQSQEAFSSTVEDPVDPSFLGAIGDRVWLDENADGVQDAGEAGIANVVIEIVDTNGTVIATGVTDLEGNYLITGLPAGEFTVRVDTNSLPAGLRANQTYDPDAATNHQTTVTLSMGEVYREADFGYNWSSTSDVTNPDADATGAIGDRVWIDADGDGIQDPGEPGLGGILVAIYYDSNGDGTYDALYTNAVNQSGVTGTGTTTTQPDGSYVFYNLPAGAYQIVVNDGDTPVGYTQTGDPDDFGTLAAIPDNQTTMPIILAPGDVYVNADFGYQPDSSSDISGTVYFDADANEDLDGADYGIGGVTVALLDDDGNVIATTRTDADGSYTFSGLPAGDYTVWVNDTGNLLGGLYQTEDPDATKDNRHSVTVNGVNDVNNVDFGHTPNGHTDTTGLIGDRIWLDLDGDGLQGAGEPGLQGVTVELYDATGTILLASTVTDANGNYTFGGLADATYIVRVDTTTLPNGGVGLTNTGDPDGGANSESSVTIIDGNIDLDQDFGYHVPPANANTIGGTVWEDRNADGTLTDGTGETPDETGLGIAGVTVVLRDANGNVAGTTTTDANGDYSFTGLPDGTYTVDVTDDANVLNGWWHSTGPTPGADNNSQSDPYTVTVAGGQADTTGDFGYYYAGAAVGNRVWFDENANGRQDEGEPGISGVTVRLQIVYDNGVTNVVTTVTDANGFYSFGNLLLDENHDGTNAATPTFILSVVNPGGGYNHTLHNVSGVPAALNSDYPLGVVATTAQGLSSVVANADPSLEVASAWYDFGFTLTPTLAVISAVRSRIEDGVAVISWDVSLELDTVGYYLERWVDGAWVRVNADLIEADPFAPTPKTYEQADPEAPPGTTQRYQIVELDGRGRLLYYGPYDLELDGGEISYETWAAGIDWGDADSSRTADPDGDGLTNWQEYLAGTDPLNANSLLRITHIEPVADGVRLTWDSAAGRVYAIEITLRLTDPFIAIQSGIEATPPANSHVLPVDFDAVRGAFFRVILE